MRVRPEVLRHRSGVNDVPRGQPPGRRQDGLVPAAIGPCAIASRSIASPPRALMAPATPLPIQSALFAALTIASTLTRGDVAFDDHDRELGESVAERPQSSGPAHGS